MRYSSRKRVHGVNYSVGVGVRTASREEFRQAHHSKIIERHSLEELTQSWVVGDEDFGSRRSGRNVEEKAGVAGIRPAFKRLSVGNRECCSDSGADTADFEQAFETAIAAGIEDTRTMSESICDLDSEPLKAVVEASTRRSGFKLRRNSR